MKGLMHYTDPFKQKLLAQDASVLKKRPDLFGMKPAFDVYEPDGESQLTLFMQLRIGELNRFTLGDIRDVLMANVHDRWYLETTERLRTIPGKDCPAPSARYQSGELPPTIVKIIDTAVRHVSHRIVNGLTKELDHEQLKRDAKEAEQEFEAYVMELLRSVVIPSGNGNGNGHVNL